MPRAKKKIKFIERTYDRKIPTNNYLKHWRVVKYWVKKKYELSEADLEMLLFIQDEGLFGYEDFDEFQAIYPWDKGRFHRLKNNGWIRVWRKRDSWRNIAALYEISAKGRRMWAKQISQRFLERTLYLKEKSTPTRCTLLEWLK
jgi:hypothetical protein